MSAFGGKADIDQLGPSRKLRLLWRDGDLDRSIGSEMVAIRSVMFGVPVPDASPYLAQKVEATLPGQVSEVAD